MLNNEDLLVIFHEIKNSITLINSSLQLVAKKHPEVNTFNYWAETMSELDILKSTITQVSSVRLCGHLNLKTVNIHRYMDETICAAPIFSQDSFCCNLSVQDNLPDVELDTMLMKHAIINLVKNAYEAMHETGTIQINVSTGNDFLNIKIIDFGGGLDPALAENIFKPFITTKNGGSGLGLSITKHIIESHHGTLTCDSLLGTGCTFTISIPFTQN